MRFDLDDPRLTAFALGELDDDQERAAIEARLAEDEEARRLVDDVRGMARMLADGLRAESGPALADEHRDAIERHLVTAVRPRVPLYAYGLAASLLVATGLLALRAALRERPGGGMLVASRSAHPAPPAPGPMDQFAPRAAMPAEPRESAERAEREANELALRGLHASDEMLAELPHPPDAVKSTTFSSLEDRTIQADNTPALPVQSAPAPPSPAPTAMAIVPGATPAAQPAQSSVFFDSRGGYAGVPAGAAGKPMAGGMSGMMGRAPAPALARGNKRAFGFQMKKAPAVPGLETAPGGGPPVPAAPEGANVVSVPAETEVLARRLMKAKEIDQVGAAKAKDRPELREEIRQQRVEANREAYQAIVENDFIRALDEPKSTFATDVDTASYAIVRRFILDQSVLPPPDAVRIEELVNYFKYDYPQPTGEDPFSVNIEIARCPWNADHRLARVGLKGRNLPEAAAKKGGNLVFLVDVSGSMNSPDKLPLLQTGLRMLAGNLTADDRVAIVVYAGSEGLALDSTPGDRQAEILRVIDEMRPGGSTNGAAGIQLAYDIAQKHFIKDGVNRVILCTDGDFNVGVTDDGSLQRLITEKAKSNVFLTVLGFGRGNLQDAKMELLADKGNGNYHYIDSPREAHKVLVEEAGGNLVTIAKDVKIQLDFNPAKVGAYRLLGYENRRMANQDFRDDAKDAGEIGAGHTVTALYELVPPEKLPPADPAEKPAFVKPAEAAQPGANESFIVRLRWKQPEGDAAVERAFPATDDGRDYAAASEDFKFASAVTSFALVLRDSKYKGAATLAAALELADASKGRDPGGYRAEFVEIIRKAQALKQP